MKHFVTKLNANGPTFTKLGQIYSKQTLLSKYSCSYHLLLPKQIARYNATNNVSHIVRMNNCGFEFRAIALVPVSVSDTFMARACISIE